MYHELKTTNPHFQSIWSAAKKLELRKNDRNYLAGDVLCLMEYNVATNTFTGREITALVTHVVFEYEGLKEGYCAMSLMSLTRKAKNIIFQP